MKLLIGRGNFTFVRKKSGNSKKSVGQGNFMFVRKKSGNFRNQCLWQPCLMRGIYTVGVGVDLIFNILKKNNKKKNNKSRHT